MAMIGRKAAVAELGPHRHELHGRVAFAAWLGVHAELLVQCRRRAQGLRGVGRRVLLPAAPPVGRALLDPAQVELPKIHWGQSHDSSGDR